MSCQKCGGERPVIVRRLSWGESVFVVFLCLVCYSPLAHRVEAAPVKVKYEVTHGTTHPSELLHESVVESTSGGSATASGDFNHAPRPLRLMSIPKR